MHLQLSFAIRHSHFAMFVAWLHHLRLGASHVAGIRRNY
jgi:hypothetical protein